MGERLHLFLLLSSDCLGVVAESVGIECMLVWLLHARTSGKVALICMSKELLLLRRLLLLLSLLINCFHLLHVVNLTLFKIGVLFLEGFLLSFDNFLLICQVF